MIIIKGDGKRFEEDFAASVPDDCWIYRLRDNAAAFSGGSNTRFTSNNIADYILFDDITKSLYLCELKSTSGTSIPYTMIRQNQLLGLTEVGKHKVIPCFIFNYRLKDNATYFMYIYDYLKMVDGLDKKSFNVDDLCRYGAISVNFKKLRTRYRYDIADMIGKTYKQCIPMR